MIKHYYLYEEKPLTYKFIPPEGFELKFLQPSEIKLIENLKNGFSFWNATYRIFQANERCLTLRKDNKIISFVWVDNAYAYYFRTIIKLKQNEAYLFYQWTENEYRGNGYAEILRFMVYEFLQKQGKDRFYSFTDVDNKSALRFKEKVNARKLKEILDIKFLFFKFHLTLHEYD